MDVDNHTYYTSTLPLMDALGDVHTDYASDKRTAAKKRPYDARNARCEAPQGFLGPAQCLGFDLGDSCLVGVHASRDNFPFAGDIMHNKFVVADSERVWTGSTNMSDSGTGGYNANIVAVLHSPEVGAWYTEEFEQMYTQGRFHGEKERSTQRVKRARIDDDTTVDVLFTPADDPIDRGVRPLIRDATERIDVAVFFLTHKQLTQDLIDAHRRGVAVRVIIDATGATNGYTKHEVLRQAGIPVKIESWGGKMHMKSAVIDGKAVVAGSMNWTSAGERSNDENTLIVRSAQHAALYQTAFDKLWRSIPDKWLTGRPDPESPDSGTACTDGSDNDFDSLRDKQDPGCGPHPPPLAPLPALTLVPKTDGHDLVKGVLLDQRKSYYGPNHPDYGRIAVRGDESQWFCSEAAARDAGYKRARER
jgi:hypothetical protein